MVRKFRFYDIKHLIKDYPDAQYYVVIGERSNGKTYSALSMALENYVKRGEQFAYIRRWGEDIRPKHMTNLFSGHVENGLISTLTKGEWSLVNYTRGAFYLARYNEDEELERSSEPLGFAFDLNSMEHNKSVSYPKINTVIFDEFMSRTGYLPNEWLLFVNTLSTIVRHRDTVKVFMLGNTVNKSCPYFTEMGLVHIKNQKPGTVNIYQYGDTNLKVIVEYTESSSKRGGKASDVYFAFDNPELKMITSGEWEIAIYPHLESKIKPSDIVGNFFVEFDQELLHGEIVSREDGDFIFLHRKTTPIKDDNEDIVYSSRAYERWNFKMCLTKQSDALSRFIMKCMRENKIFYSTNEVGEVFRNYVMWSDTYSIKN